MKEKEEEPFPFGRVVLSYIHISLIIQSATIAGVWDGMEVYMCAGKLILNASSRGASWDFKLDSTCA